jgi:hypothetical protein
VLDEPPGIPQGGQWHGQDASARVRRVIIGTWDQVMGPIRYWEAADAVFSERQITWTAKSTGKSLSSTVLEMFEFRDAKIARISVYIKDVVGLADTLVSDGAT